VPNSPKRILRYASPLASANACLHGCYLDMMNPFPMDTVVLLTIESGNALFQTRAKTHSTPNIGTGVTFLDYTPAPSPLVGTGRPSLKTRSAL
jgi:hypothetical protein